jgi:hypothetical protein
MRVSWRYRWRIWRGGWQLGVLPGGMGPGVVQPGLTASGEDAPGPVFYSSVDDAPKKQRIPGRPGHIRVARLCVLQDKDSIAVAWLIISLPIPSGSRRQQRKILESRLRKLLETERDDLLDAVTEAGLDPVWEVLTGSWQTLDPDNFEALEEAIISCQEELHQYLLGDPAGLAGAALGLPHMALLEAIADRIPIPGIDRSISELRQYAEVAGIILAILAGGHILACASFKLWAHDRLGELLDKLLDEFLRSLGARPAERSSPAQRENSRPRPPIGPDQPPRPRPPQDPAGGRDGPYEPPGSGRPGRNPPNGPGSRVFSPAPPRPPGRPHPGSADGSPSSRPRAGRPPGSTQPDQDQRSKRPAPAEVRPGPSAPPPGRQGQPAPRRPRSGPVRPQTPRVAAVYPSPRSRPGRPPEAAGPPAQGQLPAPPSSAAVGSGTPAPPPVRQEPSPWPSLTSGWTGPVGRRPRRAAAVQAPSQRRVIAPPGSALPDKNHVTGPPARTSAQPGIPAAPADDRRIWAGQIDPEETSSPRLPTPSRLYQTPPPRAEPPRPPAPATATPPVPAPENPGSRPARGIARGGMGR